MAVRSLLVAVFAAALAGGSPALADCKLQKVAEVPVTMEGLRPLVSARINGQDTRFMLDTGAFFGIVSDEAAARYGMKASIAPFGMTVSGVGGHQADARAVEAQVNFAGGTFKNMQFLVGGRAGSGDVAGVIGQNILGSFDMEYDFANGVMRFFKPDGCEKANLAYWSAGMPLQRVTFSNPGRYVQTVKSTASINGQSVRITLDTGSPVSYLNSSAAGRMGITPTSPGVEEAGATYGIYGRGLETYLAPFASFAIGDEEVRNTRLRVAKIDLGDSDMLLGADFFLSHRILIAKSQSKIYITYNGGPVFRLDREGSTAQTAANPASKPAASPSGVGAPTTGAEFARRAAASAARRDYAAAIDDDTKAIELDPNEASNYHARALARLGARQPVLAMADLDQALKLQPKDVQSLMIRGRLLVQAGDLTRAQADFDAAFKLAPQDQELLLAAANAYTGARDYEQAIALYDTWLAAHPKSAYLGQVVAERCNARATWGKQLDTALADCDLALRLNGQVSGVIENRGMVLLRMGRLEEAIAQFDSAIRLQPTSAWSLYGRGLAKLKRGAKAAGDADIAAAVALRPGLPAEAKRYGLEPGAEPVPAKS